MYEQSPDGIFNQSGAIPFRFEQGCLQILLITTRNRKRWIIPKGIIEFDQTAVLSAEQEAYEEAGIRGQIFPKPIGSYQYRKWGGICTVQVFLIEVYEEFDEWPEDYFRQRKWVSIEQVQDLVSQDGLKSLIAKVPTFLKDLKEAGPHE